MLFLAPGRRTLSGAYFPLALAPFLFSPHRIHFDGRPGWFRAEVLLHLLFARYRFALYRFALSLRPPGPFSLSLFLAWLLAWGQWKAPTTLGLRYRLEPALVAAFRGPCALGLRRRSGVRRTSGWRF